MSEVQGIITWEVAEDLGKIEGSDWVFPAYDIDDKGREHALGEELDYRGTLKMPADRRQYLSLVQFPEGYHAARVVGGNGEELTSLSSLRRYQRVLHCSCGQPHGANATKTLAGTPSPLQGGKELRGVYNYPDGPQSVIKPIVGDHDPDYLEKFQTGLKINPNARKLSIYSEGPVESMEDTRAQVEIKEENGTPEMNLILWVSRMYESSGLIDMKVGPNGVPTELNIHKTGLLKALGIKPEQGGFAFKEGSGWGQAEDKKKEAQVLRAMSEALGLGTWTGFDLKMTAAGLYKAMGQSNLDPSSVLVLNGT